MAGAMVSFCPQILTVMWFVDVNLRRWEALARTWMKWTHSAKQDRRGPTLPRIPDRSSSA